MSILVILRSESGQRLSNAADETVLREADLPDFGDLSYPYLRLVDPYGDTIFNTYQMRAVLPELQRWSIARPSLEMEATILLARRCIEHPHQFLVFVGD